MGQQRYREVAGAQGNPRAEWEQRLPEVRAILERGTAEARRVGEQTMQEVRRAMRIDYFA